MRIIRIVSTAAIAFALASGAMTLSADAAVPRTEQAAEQAKPSPQTLQLSVVISRFTGDKKIGSLPFVLVLTSGTAGTRPTTVQMGSEVPVPSSTLTDGKLVSSYRYQQVGTNISAFSDSVYEGGRHNINLSITDSQVLSDMGAKDAPPRFQTFKVSNNLILRDGQTIQFVAATDKASGEVAKVDVTLTVLK